MSNTIENKNRFIKRGRAIARFISASLRNEKIVLSRVACLGHDVIKLKEKRTNLVNQQKLRIDLFLGYMNGEPRPVTKIIEPHLFRDDILSMLEQQEGLPWFNMIYSSDIILIDSYAELTDQKFTHKKDRWSFACNYSDINHTDLFTTQFECLGLLPLDELEKYYKLYFEFLTRKYPKKKILFLHFPTALDKRKQFIDRGEAILKAIEKLTGEFPNLIDVHIPDKDVSFHEDDDFPYHYGLKTYEAFFDQIKNYL